MSKEDTTAISKDGLRYKSKQSGSLFSESTSMGTMSCYKCGLHKSRALGSFKKLLGNPLTALWFAVEKPAIENNDGVVWVFTPDAEDHVGNLQEVNPFKAGLTKVFMPKHINKRIAAQHGWFTVHYLNPSTSKFIKLENNKNYKDKLMKLRIPAKAFQDLRSDLDRCGINAATVFNDLVGICRDSEWQHTLLDDESND